MLLLLLVSCWCAQADEYYYDAQDVSMTKLDSERFRHHRAYQALNSHFEVRHISAYISEEEPWRKRGYWTLHPCVLRFTWALAIGPVPVDHTPFRCSTYVIRYGLH